MTLESVSTAPAIADFTTLEEHQSETPGTFFGGKPVLYLNLTNTALHIDRQKLSAQPALSSFASAIERKPTATNGTANANGDGTSNALESNGDGTADDTDNQVTIPNVDIYVTSETLTIYSSKAAHGVKIPYPSICIHALQQGHVQVQLVLFDQGDEQAATQDQTDDQGQDQTRDADDDVMQDVEILEIHIYPSASTVATPALSDSITSASPSDSTHEHLHAGALYDAIAKCSALNPDPDGGEDGDGAQGHGMAVFGGGAGDAHDDVPGAGGWITAENVDDYVDENGEFIGIGHGTDVDGAEGERERAGKDKSDRGEVEGEDGHQGKWWRTS